MVANQNSFQVINLYMKGSVSGTLSGHPLSLSMIVFNNTGTCKKKFENLDVF